MNGQRANEERRNDFETQFADVLRRIADLESTTKEHAKTLTVMDRKLGAMEHVLNEAEDAINRKRKRESE